MHSHLLIVITLFTISLAGCSSNPRYDSEVQELAMGNDGCYVIEIYDSEDDICYLNCDGLSDEKCDELALQIYGEFDEFINEDFEGDNSQLEEELVDTQIASYSIDETLALTELSNIEPENDEKFQRIWQSVLAILPEQFLRNELVEYHINTDGLDNTLAYVTLHESIPEKWVIAIDPADFTNEKDKNFIHTVIHEFAHIVFLNKTQVEIDTIESCNSYSFAEGCSLNSSYINAFYTRFWTDIIKDNPSALADIDAADEDEITQFHAKYETHFPSEYAATNPIEDAAEIFVHFVLGKKPQSPKIISQQKIEFLYQFPELIELRTKIRAKLRKTSDK